MNKEEFENKFCLIDSFIKFYREIIEAIEKECKPLYSVPPNHVWKDEELHRIICNITNYAVELDLLKKIAENLSFKWYGLNKSLEGIYFNQPLSPVTKKLYGKFLIYIKSSVSVEDLEEIKKENKKHE